MKATHTQEQEVLDQVLEEDVRQLTLINDDVNTFDHVINCLIFYCDHEPVQAEQCATLTHFKGSCDIKRGSLEELMPVKQALQKELLRVAID